MAEKKKKVSDNLKFKLLIGIVTIILIVLMFPKGESIESEVSEGAIWIHDDLIAPFSFPVKKDPELYNKEITEAENSVFPVFLKEASLGIDSLKKYNSYLLNILDQNIQSDTSGTVNPTFLSADTFNKFLAMRKRETSLSRGNTPPLKNVLTAVSVAIEEVFKKGILSIESDTEIKDSIAVRSGNIDQIEPAEKFLRYDEGRREVRRFIKNLNYPEDIENALVEYAMHFVFPNLQYSKELTNLEIEQARNNISLYSGIVNENERIIAKHDRITKQSKLKIESYKEAKGDSIGDEGIILQLIGKLLHISFLMALLVIYLYLFRKKIYHDDKKLILIALIFVFVSFITFLVNQVSVNAPIYFLIFVPAASMILTIVFDSRVGFYTTVILTLIVGALRGNDYSFMAMNFIAGGLSVYTVRDIKNRTQIFRSFLFILLGYFVSILAFGLERFASAETMLIEFAFAGSNALISPVLTYGFLIFFERIFNITTDLTLLELSNFDRPLLRELGRRATGTFNHSMTMGTIAEAAAEKIGANPLLARVGAYYHDIGKSITPQGFVENQMQTQNIHENLTPEESVKLIKKHVEEGIELAEEHNLPQEIIDFIPMHHGTTTVSYFFEKAKKMYGEEKVDVNDYKYPGPKPNTKETAIIMLADGCESAVRSISDPEPQRVENVINNIFEARIKEGQLDQAPVTFKDITSMKEVFLSILLGQHHRRIKYPKQEEVETGESDEKKEE